MIKNKKKTRKPSQEGKKASKISCNSVVIVVIDPVLNLMTILWEEIVHYVHGAIVQQQLMNSIYRRMQLLLADLWRRNDPPMEETGLCILQYFRTA